MHKFDIVHKSSIPTQVMHDSFNTLIQRCAVNVAELNAQMDLAHITILDSCLESIEL
jgi:hypothetical protein